MTKEHFLCNFIYFFGEKIIYQEDASLEEWEAKSQLYSRLIPGGVWESLCSDMGGNGTCCMWGKHHALCILSGPKIINIFTEQVFNLGFQRLLIWNETITKHFTYSMLTWHYFKQNTHMLTYFKMEIWQGFLLLLLLSVTLWEMRWCLIGFHYIPFNVYHNYWFF